MAAYDDFAWFYNRYWNEEFHSLAFPVLDRIWLAGVAPHGHILDICCGTGYLAGLLIARGYAVTGIDASPAMIGHARANVPLAEFHVGDAANFQLPARFDGAVCTFDSLNHLLTVKELQSAFGSIARALKPGARFVFDVLGEEAYQLHWGEGFAIVRDDHLLTITGAGYHFRTRRSRCTITMFRLIEGLWQRSDVTIHERSHTADEIAGCLRLAGFGEIVTFDARDLGVAGDIGEGRTFYVTTRL